MHGHNNKVCLSCFYFVNECTVYVLFKKSLLYQEILEHWGVGYLKDKIIFKIKKGGGYTCTAINLKFANAQGNIKIVMCSLKYWL